MRPGTRRRTRSAIVAFALAAVLMVVGATIVSASAADPPWYTEPPCGKVQVGAEGDEGTFSGTISSGSWSVSVDVSWWSEGEGQDKVTHWTVVVSGDAGKIFVKSGSDGEQYFYGPGTHTFDYKQGISHISICPPGPGSLLITKEITGDTPPGGDWTYTQFAVNVTGPSYPTGTGPLYFDGSGQVSLTNLQPGSYYVTEVVSGAYTASGWGGVTVYNDNTANMTITNNYQAPGSLVITKAITGDTPPGGDWTYSQFAVIVEGPGGYISGPHSFPNDPPHTVTLSNLAPGPYTVTEVNSGPYTLSYSGSGDGGVTVVGGETAGITVTNDYTTQPGGLEITKAITGDTPPGGDWTYSQFAVMVTGPNSYSSGPHSFPNDSPHTVTLIDLEPGDYYVTEVNSGPYTATGWGDVTVYDGQTAGMTITNYYEEEDGSLLIQKEIEDPAPPGGHWTYGQFVVVVTSENGYDSGPLSFNSSGQILLTGLEPDWYQVTEVTSGPYAVSGGGLVYVSAGEVGAGPTLVTITNTGPPRGSLEIVKAIEGPEPLGGHWDYSQFYVVVTCDDPVYNSGPLPFPDTDPHKIVLTNLFPGEYTVTELTYGPYTVSMNPPDGKVTVVPDDPQVPRASVEITNTGPPRGSLEITKAIDGPAPPPNGVHWDYSDFEVVVTCDNPVYDSGPLSFPDTYPHKIVFDDLFPGVYTVAEVKPYEFPYAVSGEGPVTVSNDVGAEPASVTITNTGPPRGSLVITKTIGGDEPPTSVGYGDFTVIIEGPYSYYLMATFDGTYGNEPGKIILSDLFPGPYTVTEVDPGIFWNVQGGGGVTVVGGQEVPALVEITNTGSSTTTSTPTTEGGTTTTNTTVRRGTTTTKKSDTTTTTPTTVSGQTTTTVLGILDGPTPSGIQTGLGGTAGGAGPVGWVLIGLSVMLIVGTTARYLRPVYKSSREL